METINSITNLQSVQKILGLQELKILKLNQKQISLRKERKSKVVGYHLQVVN